MKKFFPELFKNIFGWHILSFAGILFIDYLIQDSSYFIIRYLLLLTIVIVILSISYFSLSNYYKLDRKNDGNKPALAIRTIVFRLLWNKILSWIGIWLFSFGIIINKSFIALFSLILWYSLIFSLSAIMIGIKLRTLLVLMIVLLPILLLLGVFDIKWWALVTGFITLWSFINSEDFLMYLRGGKKLENVPKELKYKWSVNKFTAYIVTFLVYASFVISSFFEKKIPCSFEDYLFNGLTRVSSMLYLMMFLVVLFSLLFGYYYLLNIKERRGRVAKCILSIGEKVGLDKFNKTLNLYIKAKKGELK